MRGKDGKIQDEKEDRCVAIIAAAGVQFFG